MCVVVEGEMKEQVLPTLMINVNDRVKDVRQKMIDNLGCGEQGVLFIMHESTRVRLCDVDRKIMDWPLQNGSTLILQFDLAKGS